MCQRIALRLGFCLFLLAIMTTLPMTTYSQTPVDPCAGGTLAYWPMDEGNGTVVHDICNGYDGTFTQGATWATDAEGPYLQFTGGSGERITINESALSNNTSVTVEVRMMKGSGPGSRVLGQMGTPNAGQLRFLLANNGESLEVWGATGSANYRLCPNLGNCFPAGQWTTISFQIQGTQVWLYKDGILVNSGTLPFPQTLRSTNATTEIGTGELNGSFGGKIQYVRISSGIRNDFLLTRPPENQPPTANAGGDKTVQEGGIVVLDGIDSSDPDEDPLTFEWDLDNDGIFETPGQSVTFSAAGRDGPDNQTIGLQVCDTSDVCDSDTINISISNVSPSIISIIKDAPISEGASATIVVDATDPGGVNDPLSYEFDCNNDLIYEIGPQPNNDASCAFDDNGSFSINVQVVDDDGGSVTSSTNVIVNNEAPSATFTNNGPVLEGSDITLSLTNPSDPSTIDTAVGFDYAFDCGSGFGSFTSNNSATCPTPDNELKTVKGQIRDKDGGVMEYTANVMVNNVNPTVVLAGTTIANEGDTKHYSYTVSDPGTDTFALISESCGTGGTLSNSTFEELSGNGGFDCAFPDGLANTAVTVTVSDDDGGIGGDSLDVLVNNLAPNITLSGAVNAIEGSPYELTLGNVIDSGEDTVTQYIVRWGDGESDTYPHNGIITHTYADGQNQTVTITVDLVDEDGVYLNVATHPIIVNNVAPSVDQITVPLEPININDQGLFSVDVIFSDPGGTYDEPYTCDFDLDNDGLNDNTITSVVGTSCSTILNYTEPGVYTVNVTVTDKDGAQNSGTASTFIVIFNSTGGYVTGGGWIDSPAGACPDWCGNVTGKAAFGFSSKYKKGASLPTGNTHFKFNAGELDFRSDSYDWLVVNQGGANAQFKGSGTIDGNLAPTGALFNFMIWAGENDPPEKDTFRIKIWYEDGTGEVVVYDNGFAQSINGGNIKIDDGK